jgi:hypothetical protein
MTWLIREYCLALTQFSIGPNTHWQLLAPEFENSYKLWLQ